MALIQTRPSEPPTINLLPSEIRSTQRTKRIFTIAVAVVGVLILILIVITIVQRMQISSQEDILREEQAKAAALRTQIEALRDIEILASSVETTRGTLATALAGDINWTKLLDDIDENIPSNSWVSSITVTNAAGTTALGEPSLGTVQYSASVITFPGLADWLEKMEAIDGQRFVYMTSGNENEDTKVVTFGASSHLTEVMLSGRCQGATAKCP